MAEGIFPRRFRYAVLFAALSFVVVFLRLLPIDAGLKGMPGPDLILLTAFAWVLRRPRYIPVLLFAAVILMADVLFLRPLGLWTAICVIGLEVLRGRVGASRDQSLIAEWGSVAGVIVLMTLGYNVVLVLFGVPRPILGLTLIETAATIAAYPVVAILSVRVLGVRRPAVAGQDMFGARS